MIKRSLTSLMLAPCKELLPCLLSLTLLILSLVFLKFWKEDIDFRLYPLYTQFDLTCFSLDFSSTQELRWKYWKESFGLYIGIRFNLLSCLVRRLWNLRWRQLKRFLNHFLSFFQLISLSYFLKLIFIYNLSLILTCSFS